MKFSAFAILFIAQVVQGLELNSDPHSAGACTSYIESASWIERYDPGTGKKEWSLSVIPTSCGRVISSDKTNDEYAELVKKFGHDWQWKKNDSGGMRRQLVCHLSIARDKTPWNLEPYRPDVTHEVSVASGCNNGVATGAGTKPLSSQPPWILSPIENATAILPFSISGKSAAGATVDVCLEGAAYCFNKCQADSNGHWFVDATNFGAGTYKVTARQTFSGQVSSWAGNRTFTVR